MARCGAGAARRSARVAVTGALERVRRGRPGGRPVLQAELGSEDSRIRLIWLGREHIPGIEPGRVVAVEGRLSLQHGQPTIFNPRYHLMAEQAAGDPAAQPPRRSAR